MSDAAATTVNEQDRRRAAHRTAWWLALIALAVYFGFIALSVVRGD
jgi:uncharacterized membrane protein (DUF485 family)